MSLEAAILANVLSAKSSLYEKFPNQFVYEKTGVSYTTADAYSTILSISGSGYLSEVYTFNVYDLLRVTIDGVVTEWKDTDTSNSFVQGFLRYENYITGSYASPRVPHQFATSQNISSYTNPVGLSDVWGTQMVGGNYVRPVYLDGPILFKSQLLIEMGKHNTTYQGAYRIAGGHA